MVTATKPQVSNPIKTSMSTATKLAIPALTVLVMAVLFVSLLRDKSNLGKAAKAGIRK